MDAQTRRPTDGAACLADRVKCGRIWAALRGGPLAWLGHLAIVLDERREALGRSRASEAPEVHWRLRSLLQRLRRRGVALYPARALPASVSLGWRVIIVSHDLGASGAPRIAFEIARDLSARGLDVLVFTSADGPYRTKLQALGVAVAVKGDLFERPGVFPRVSKFADAVVLNTTVSASLAACVVGETAAYVYLHEISSLMDGLQRSPRLREGLTAAQAVWAGNADTAEVVRGLRPDVTIFPYGLDPAGFARLRDHAGPLIIHVFGSFERRKGQDIALRAVQRIAARYPGHFILKMNGRVLENDFHEDLRIQAQGKNYVQIRGELDYQAYLSAMEECDIVLVPSRDDTLPLVSLDALSGGRVLVCTGTTGTAAYLQDGVSGFVTAKPEATDLSEALERALSRRTDYAAIADAGRKVFTSNFSRAAFSDRLAAELGLQTTARRSAGRGER